MRTDWDLLAFSFQVFCIIFADAGLEGSIVSFVLVAVGNKVRFNAYSIHVSNESNEALADYTVEGFIGTAGPAGSEDPEVTLLAIALSISKIAVLSTVLVAGAFSIND